MSKKIVRIALIVVGVIVLAVAGSFIYIWVSGGSGEPTREVEAEAVQPVDPQTAAYDVDRQQSEARFIINEVLRGRPNTVVGTTNQIAGSIAIQFDPAAVEIGEFVINVRSIRTDDEVRDRTIRGQILESARDEYEFSSFRPVEVANVPDVIAAGDTFEIDVIGDLTVRDVTTRTTFAMEISVESEDRISGLGRTTITWAELDITIPYVGGDSIVASVADSLDLELAFVANRRLLE